MGRIRVSTVINASPEQVWAEVRDIERHVDWMADAAAITFTTPQTSGVGTTFDCLTKVGPISLTDRMSITEWREGRSMGVRHEGLVTGVGAFTLARIRRDRTRFTWEEHLTFPWWMGGAVGGAVGGVVMRRIWKRNLRVLKALIESGRS
jgi:carbon monoxide dehydrogenase subunit G